MKEGHRTTKPAPAHRFPVPAPPPVIDKESEMANLITSLRFVLLFFLVAMAYTAPPTLQLANPFLLVFIIVLDGLDGYVARQRGETSLFGSVYDIAVDRVVENVLWIVLADLDLVPVWVALLFITRGVLVDTIRSHAAAQGETAFGMMRTTIGQFLVASRFMRGFYGTLKAVTFSWLLLLQPMPALHPDLWLHWASTASVISDVLVYSSVFVCLLRGLPVVLEFYLAEIQMRRVGAAEGNQ
jgi:CDP-diacylglycerol--glycerol-3-phosphate 3-phosphatidyltransferase